MALTRAPQPRRTPVWRACLIGMLALCALASGAQRLPPEVQAALARAHVARDAVALLVADAEGKAPVRLSHRADVAMNPASVMKLLTTYAALDLLGPAFSWKTPVYLEGAVRDGALYGNLYIVGQGDPKLVQERIWLLLRRVQGLGIKNIAGDIVLDHNAFEPINQDPGEFDGEPLRPYNAAPDALLLNYKSVLMTFVPDVSAKVARVGFEPALAGVQMQASVPLLAGDCGDYRASLKADFADPVRIRFAGGYPASCAEKSWPVAYADPNSFAMRAIDGIWSEMGGSLQGRVRDGRLPPGLAGAPVFQIGSPTLAEIIRDINKFSNNVMAQQLFLTLSLPAGVPAGQPGSAVATRQAARLRLAQWWTERLGDADAPVLENGSGLSRRERISAQALARLLQHAWASPLMPELLSSLPISGVDGTLRRSRVKSLGSAHLKTGSLREVSALAGFVHAASGRRYVVVGIINHANAQAARPALEALVDWARQDQ